MVHLAAMNLTLRGLPNVRIRRRNVLTTTLDNERKRVLGLPLEGFHVTLANPPFSGRLDRDRIVDEVKVGTTTATEILFLKYMMDNLRPGGRCGLVVPEGLLFGSTGAHKEIRTQLIENYTAHAVLSLPGGVFQPYSGVKTSVLLFGQGGPTDKVLFLHADHDGYKLDANHDTPIEADDLPALVDAYKNRAACWDKWRSRDGEAEWTEKWWFATTEEIRAAGFNLSASRYRPLVRTAVEHRDPRELLDELAAIQVEIAEGRGVAVSAVRGKAVRQFQVDNLPSSWRVVRLVEEILAITYDEIMPLLEQRVGREVSLCLEEYATLPGNNQRYPWAAKLDDSSPPDYDDDSGVRFGRLPDVLDDTSTTMLGGADASRWPQPPANDCKFVSPVPSNTWWLSWKDLVFYAVAEAYAPAGTTPPPCGVGATCLTVNPSSIADRRVVVMVAGRPLRGVVGGGDQKRPLPSDSAATANTKKGKVQNYLELENAQPPDSGLPPDDLFVLGPASATFNDVTCVDGVCP
jgi:hypothetical protein